MHLENEIEYHQRREAEERAAADAAPEAINKNIHTALADRHADRVWSITEQIHEGGAVREPSD